VDGALLEKIAMTDHGSKGQAMPEIAFYYPNPMWQSGDWIKNLILFFDGVGLLVPNYMLDRPELLDPAIVAGLREHDLLHILEPEIVVDAAATKKLAAAMSEIITSGALDRLATEPSEFAELSYSRLGGHGDFGLASMILEELISRGLARDTEDGLSIPMHPMVRSLVLVLLSQILRPQGAQRGIDLSPVTDRPEIVNSLKELLSIPNTPSSGHVVASDLMFVGVNLGPVPIDEVLSFRREHLDQHKAYTRTVRRFVRELSLLGEEGQAAALTEREEELTELADALANNASKAWKQPASFALSAAGAAWTFATGDPIGGILAGAAAISGRPSSSSMEVGAYSYLFKIKRQYG
jgi:hypothetical protein